MHQIPECLQRRYQVMDELVNDLTSTSSQQSSINSDKSDAQNYGLKLMCKFWNILKENSNNDLQNADQERLTQNMTNGSIFGSHNIACYYERNSNTGNSHESNSSSGKPRKVKSVVCEKHKHLEINSPTNPICNQPELPKQAEVLKQAEVPKQDETICSMCEKPKQPAIKSLSFEKPKQPEIRILSCEKHKQPEIKTSTCEKQKQPEVQSLSCEKQKQPEVVILSCEKHKQPDMCSMCEKPDQPEIKSPMICEKHSGELKTPLTQALDNMKEAASVEKKCCEKTAELLSIQEQLKSQIAQLEEREEEEVNLLKEADAIWNKMEDEYKQKLSESKIRQEGQIKQLSQVETSACKWKKNKKNLEEQISKANEAIHEIKDRYKKKTNDLKTIESDTADLQKKIDSNTKDLANASKALEAKRNSFDERMKNISEESKTLQITKKHEEKLKNEKIQKGNECVKEAREELVKLCGVLLKKKLENENLRAEAKALAEEISLLKTTYDTCDVKCKEKEQSVLSEIDKYKTQIENFSLRCKKCDVSCDTISLRKYCTDCPRCQEEMEPCIFTDDTCKERAMNDCVCIRIKTNFMNNVFENMRTVLERQINTKPGKAVSGQVLQCLKNSTNGKLDPETRKKLQQFILATLKTNLNLTIIGGAVKTRCEMDPDTYQEMMNCLNKVKTVKAEKPQKLDKGTHSRKGPCARWAEQECNCANGPKACMCKKLAPKPPSDPEPCGQLDEDKEDIGELSICPHKENTPCGPLCANVSKSDIAKKVEKSWKPSPCGGEKCTFRNMRAAQCTLGKDSVSQSIRCGTRGFKTNTPIVLVPSDIDQTLNDCDCINEDCDCYDYDNFENEQNQGCERKSRMQYEIKFNEMLNRNKTTLPVTVVGQNGITASFNAELKKTTSGRTCLDVKKISNVGEIASPMAEYPVLLLETNSSLKLIIGDNNKHHNAVLKRDSTGKKNLILKDVNVSHKNNNATLRHHEKLFHVIIKNKEAEYAECIFVRATPSGNYKFVLDKEFEKLQKEVINDCLGNINECSVNVSTIQSGTCVIDFDEYCNYHQHYHNALLKKSDSGNIKLIANVTDSKILKKHKLLTDRCRSRFESLYKKLSTFTKYLQKGSSKQKQSGKQLECVLKPNTDIRMKIQDQKHFIAEPIVKLNEISPGEYFVIFKNKGEEFFIMNLLSSWLGCLPIQKSTEQDLTVILNLGGEVNNLYGWLILSSDGKILVVVDKTSQRVQTNCKMCCHVLYRKRDSI